jgi:DNA/RNA-binding domain of Phe-tRNA-synthetase-like protein
MLPRFSYATSIREDFPELVTGVLHVEGITRTADVTAPIVHFSAIANQRLGGGAESALPEIQAWRQTFAKMGLKPTQYRCASEALLRRFRKEGSLPGIHPLIDVCNAISLAFAVPIAVFDLQQVEGDLQVRRANGDETYNTFSGEIEHPEPGEVIFADAAANAHARRWTNRQSGRSAVRDGTRNALIVCEAMHDSARVDMACLLAAITATVQQAWPLATVTELPSR